jgi:hypothetical protein
MTTHILTSTHIYSDTRGTVNNLKHDGFQKFIHDPRAMRTYFITGSKSLVEHLIYLYIHGEFLNKDKEKDIIENLSEADEDFFYINAQGEVVFINISLNKDKTIRFMESINDYGLFEPIKLAYGSGKPFAEGALLASDNMDIVFKAISLTDKHTSPSYFSICRTTHTATFHPGI